ncbi:MAG: 3-deoxy-7-phosphoheptulonate synthase [Gammaproteobacteria bacterium]|nr:3-deoxy-7-phosphoheptulonate synthase [Gammaproteobacteria bacterium]
MIIVLKPKASEADAKEILAGIERLGLTPLHMPGVERVVLGALGDERVLRELNLSGHPAVESVKPILTPYKLVGRELHPHDTVVNIGEVPVGGREFAVVAGPCAVETTDQLMACAEAVKAQGARLMRGGAFKPRSSPYSFQGHGHEGLRMLKEVSGKTGLPIVTEIMDANDIDRMEEIVGAYQVGARNMQNFSLLKALGRSRKPVILKRGLAATIEEFLLAAEYILAGGNDNVILCERGIRTFETATRNTLDLNAVAYIKQRSHLPILVDPSHGTGIRELVTPLARAAAAVGADGIIVEVHHDPKLALSDGHQSLYPQEFKQLMADIKPFVEAAGRVLA